MERMRLHAELVRLVGKQSMHHDCHLLPGIVSTRCNFVCFYDSGLEQQEEPQTVQARAFKLSVHLSLPEPADNHMDFCDLAS
eukprot:4334658-Amphidinium_carterae.1